MDVLTVFTNTINRFHYAYKAKILTSPLSKTHAVLVSCQRLRFSLPSIIKAHHSVDFELNDIFNKFDIYDRIFFHINYD